MAKVVVKNGVPIITKTPEDKGFYATIDDGNGGFKLLRV